MSWTARIIIFVVGMAVLTASTYFWETKFEEDDKTTNRSVPAAAPAQQSDPAYSL